MAFSPIALNWNGTNGHLEEEAPCWNSQNHNKYKNIIKVKKYKRKRINKKIKKKYHWVHFRTKGKHIVSFWVKG